jgi:hypothetical protein
MDGVAVPPDVGEPALERLQQQSEHAEGVFGRRDRSVRERGHGETGRAGAAGRARFHHGGQLLYRARLRRVESGPRAKVVDDVLERLDLGRQLTGGGAVAVVFGLQLQLGGAEPFDLVQAVPSCAEAHGDRQRHEQAGEYQN